MPPKSQMQKKKCLMTRKPHFFKVLLGDFTQQLKIPPNFLKHISTSRAPKRAILQGPSGSNWRVGLGKNMKGTFLTGGWKKFAKDHSLREHEFLVFQYDGDMHFTVLIFDTTACEREDVLAVRPWGRPVQCEQGRRKRGRPSKRSLEVKRIVKRETGQHDLSLQLVEHDDAHELNPLQMQPSIAFQDAKGCLPHLKAKTGGSRPPTKTKGRKRYISTRRPVTEEERLKAQAAANLFTSAFPYIVIRMAMTHVYRPYMRMPNWFSRAHLPHKRSSLVLRDPSGKSCVVTYIPSTCSRSQISGGWSAFARTNKLEEGDYCAFELVGPIELRVHIFRVVEVALPIALMPAM